MKSAIIGDLIAALQTVQSDRHKLIILLGKFGAGKTAILKQTADEVGGKYLNLNMELSEKLLGIPTSHYLDGATVHAIIDQLCEDASPHQEPLFVDNLEILFSPELGKINPIDTFKRISRERPVVIALPAYRHGSSAIYSSSGHEDYVVMPLEEYIVIEIPEE